MKDWAIVLLLFSLLPIWRYPPEEQPFNLWQLFAARTKERKHIPVSEAIERAREAMASSAITV